MTPTQQRITPEPAASPAPSTVPVVAKVCPHCGSTEVRESSTRRGMDLMPSNIGKDAYRCRCCRGRFYLRKEADDGLPGSQAAARRRRSDRKRDPIWKHPSLRRYSNEIMIVIGSMVSFGIFLYVLARSGIAF